MLHPDLPEFWIPISDHRENLRARQSVLEYDVYNIGRATSKKKKTDFLHAMSRQSWWCDREGRSVAAKLCYLLVF